MTTEHEWVITPKYAYSQKFFKSSQILHKSFLPKPGSKLRAKEHLRPSLDGQGGTCTCEPSPKV